ncbi:MAG TPA: class I SAM-dependent methyltransferase [Candidatus Baltobacteraceae bacterium]|nr:class I SAM-dependent methyltransferase [Candidatus Baltobacteraceae bacterium]
MSDERAAEFRKRTLANWTSDETVAAWRRWHDKIATQQREVTEALRDAANIAPGQSVLDLATGSGEPALTFARVVSPSGRVVGTDVSEGMLVVAREFARREGIQNIEFAYADAEQLPFDDGAFDAVTSRMGVMFFIDLERSLNEIHRVLRPGGRVAFAAWGPMSDTSMFSACLEPFVRRASPPDPPPGAPHPQRFAASGTLSTALRKAGFSSVAEETRITAAPWFGTPEEQWQSFCDLASPPYVDDMPEPDKSEATAEAIENLRSLYDGTAVQTRAAVVIASATA